MLDPDQDNKTVEERELEFVLTIRKKFFDFLRPLLLSVKDCIKEEFKSENRKNSNKNE